MRKTLLLVFMLMAAVAALAQDDLKKNELGLLLGVTFVPDRTVSTILPDPRVDVGNALTFQATYARHLTGKGKAALYLEIPFVASPNADIRNSDPAAADAVAALFITPGLRVKFNPAGKLSPWLSLGGGYAQFEEGYTGGPANTRTHRGALQFGGGLDVDTGVKILAPIALRGEVRDFYTGSPRYGFPVNGGQHNVVVSGGFVLKF